MVVFGAFLYFFLRLIVRIKDWELRDTNHLKDAGICLMLKMRMDCLLLRITLHRNGSVKQRERISKKETLVRENKYSILEPSNPQKHCLFYNHNKAKLKSQSHTKMQHQTSKPTCLIKSLTNIPSKE